MIKAQPTVKLPPNATAYSDDELVRQVRHYYPDLNHILGEMLERFAGGHRSGEELDHANQNVDTVTHEVGCPHCGSKLKVEVES